MLQIDFGKILSKVTPEVKKAVPKKEQKAKAEVVYATLGDVSRFQSLPDVVTEEFVSLYSQTIEEILYPYVASKLLTIGYASRYRQALLETIFGSENHLGLFHYLKERNVDGNTEKEIVIYAEQLLVKGWRISKEGNQYWIINSDMKKVLDVTGRAPMFKEVATLSFDASSAHVFLDESVAAKIAALAKTLGQDADSLAASGNLDVLLARVSDDEFAGYVINYNALRRILKKSTKYPTLSDGISMVDIYKEGYRLSSQLSFPFSEKAIFSLGDSKFSVKAVENDFNKEHLTSKYMLSAIASRIKSEIFRGTKVVSPEIIEIKDFRETIALMTEIYPSEFSDTTFSETLDIIENLLYSSKPSKNSAKLLSYIASLAVVEGILLGNSTFSPSSFSIDSVSGKVFSKTSSEYFSRPIAELESFGEEGKEVNRETFETNFRLITPETASSFVKLVPEDIKNRISSVDIDVSQYPYQLNSIVNYFQSAKRFILGG